MIRPSAFALPILFVLIAALAGCQSDQDAEPAAPPPLAMPTTQDDGEWRRYIGQMVSRHVRVRRGVPPFAIYISPSEDEEKTQAVLDNAAATLARGVVKDTIIAFGSRDSALMASRMGGIFENLPSERLKGARVVFVGRAEDRATAEAAAAESGAEFIFLEFGS